MSSPHSLTFPAEQQPNSSFPYISATHAGGIQPPASFFRPSRPRQYSRPNSSSSNVQQPDLADIYPLSSDDNHQNVAESIGCTDSIAEDGQFPLKRIKQSREPLLPSMRTLPTHPADSGPTFESKLSDDDLEAGGAYAYPPTSKVYDHSHIQQHNNFNGGQSISAHASRNSALLSVASPSPELSFVPTPPDRYPPLSAVPVINPKTGKYVRRYESHPSRNRFFLGGRLLTGGDSPWAFIASFSLVLIIAGVWFGTTAVWWWQNKSPAVAAVGAYLSLLTISTMLTTASIDPGILPRTLDPDPPYPSTSSDGVVRGPMPRDLKVRSDVVRVKYCSTCKTYRPPRSSHCKMCDNCVDGCDHHCQWVNNCVGRRNYTTFFALLLAATTTLILIIVTSALHIFFLTRRENTSFRRVLAKAAGSAVVFCLSIAVIWPVAALLTYHMRLLLLNITTIEQIRNQAHKSLVPGPPPPNPFSHGNWRRNLLAVLCRPQGYSWFDGHEIMTEDRRTVNPGMVQAGEEEWEQGHSHPEEEGEERKEED